MIILLDVVSFSKVVMMKWETPLTLGFNSHAAKAGDYSRVEKRTFRKPLRSVGKRPGVCCRKSEDVYSM